MRSKNCSWIRYLGQKMNNFLDWFSKAATGEFTANDVVSTNINSFNYIYNMWSNLEQMLGSDFEKNSFSCIFFISVFPNVYKLTMNTTNINTYKKSIVELIFQQH